MPEKTLWRVDIHSQGLEVASSLTDLIHERLRAALCGLECPVVRAHVRLYAETGGCTCYIRVDLSPGGGFARGDSGEGARQAVDRASARVRAAAVAHVGTASAMPRRR
jgi:hypothetical protein